MHLFVLPDVASSGVAGVVLLLIILFISNAPCWFTAILHIILSYTFYFVFSSDIRCISITCIHKSIYMLVCENDIFLGICKISVNFLHILQWIFSHKCNVYEVFTKLFSTWCSIFCNSNFLCSISCFLSYYQGQWGYCK